MERKRAFHSSSVFRQNCKADPRKNEPCHALQRRTPLANSQPEEQLACAQRFREDCPMEKSVEV
jgi:hypothetical protein